MLTGIGRRTYIGAACRRADAQMLSKIRSA
jgi:hypothetical protein